jgi:hypothetical protein
MTDPYTIWNQNLSAYFFNEGMAGREVLLYANFDLIEKVGANIGGIKGFVEAVKTGPGWIKNGDLCVKAYKLFQAWKFDRSGEYPPYIAYLVSFVLANYIEGDFDANAYYPRLRTLLSLEHDSTASHCFDKMYELWDDLEKWSKEDREEELGSFTARVRGGKWHIGLPLSQTILSKEERDRLSLIFSEAFFEPGSSQPAVAIVDALRKFGSKHLSKKTIRLLNSTQDKELTAALVDFVREELIAWNGFSPASIENETKAGGEPAGYTRSAVKVCLRVEPFSKKVNAILRVKSNSDFPVDGLNLFLTSYGQQSTRFDCKRASKFWSTPLRQLNQPPVDAFVFDWTKQLLLQDEERSWTSLMKASNVKWFARGKNEQLPDDWVESSQLPEKNAEFALACHPGSLETTSPWIEAGCELLKPEVKLPNGWTFFQIKIARASFPGTEALTAGNQPVLRFRGGIRLGNRNAFISYCAPQVLIENPPGDIDVLVTGNGISSPVKLNKGENENKWSFPAGLPAGQSLKIQVLSGGSEIKFNGTRMITFEEGNLLSSKIASVTSNVARDRHGRLINLPEDGKSSVNGAKVHNYHPGTLKTKPFTLFASGTKIVLLGQRTGEVAALETGLQIDFTPVWALVKCERKRWLVQFCAQSLEQAKPLRGLPGAPGKKVKEWKRLIWTNRMVNDSSQLEFASIKKLWEAYKNAAARL